MLIVRFHSASFPMRVIEWMLAGILLSWGVVLLQNAPVFASYPVYRELSRFAPQHTWGTVCFIAGGLRFAALAVNGAWRPTPHIRCGMAFLSCFFWLQISLGLIGTGITNTGLAVYPWLLLAEVYSVFRASIDARISDERAKSLPRA